MTGPRPDRAFDENPTPVARPVGVATCGSVGACSGYDAHTALIVVDVQNDFADPKGSLSVEGGTAIIPTINAEIAAAREAGGLVVFTQDWHPPSTPHFAKDGGIWPVHCVANTWGAELYPDLDAPEDAPRVRKGVNGEDGYSGFTTRDPVTGETKPDRARGASSATAASRRSSSAASRRTTASTPRRSTPGGSASRRSSCSRRCGPST